jgi:hypothetical protein
MLGVAKQVLDELRVRTTSEQDCEAAMHPIDTNLIPPGTQYGATRSNPQQRKSLRNAAFATPCTPLQRLSDHS